MLTDVHSHAFDPKIAHKVLEFLENHYGISPVGDGTLDDLLSRARAAGLERVVVHTAATSPDQVRPANNWAIKLQSEHPEVLAFGSTHPGYDKWEAELDRLQAHGIRGLKLHPDFQGFRLDDPALDPIFEATAGRFAFMLHVGDQAEPEKNPSCPFKVMRLLSRHPGLQVAAAHLGGYLHWKWALECGLIGSAAFIDTSSSLPFLDDRTLMEIFRRHPRERILFGSDYPLYDPGVEAERLKDRLALSSAELDELMRNADGLVGG
jgi:hypothetical protein